MPIDVTNHPAFLLSSDVRELSRPLEENFGITYFNFVRRHANDRSFVSLSSRPDWQEHFYAADLYNTKAVNTIRFMDQEELVLWSEYEADEAFCVRRADFNIDNGVTICKRHEDHFDFYHFASTPDNYMINNFYIHNQDLLERFILYFNDRAASMIKTVTEHKIILPGKPQHTKEERDDRAHKVDKATKDAFLQAMPIKRYFIDDKHDVYLSSREAQSLYLLMQGKTAKEIGQVLSLSNRTVESYLDNIKIKLNCYKKKDLIAKAKELKLEPVLRHAVVGLSNP